MRTHSRGAPRPGAAVALAVALLFAAGAPAAAASGATAVRIGVTLGLTGRYADLAVFQQNGFRLWEREVNARGGILGRPVQLSVLDDGGDPARAVALYTRLIEQDRVDLVFGPYSSDVTAAMLPIAERHGYPVIVSGASADSLWEQGYRNAFGLFLPASRVANPFLDLLNIRGVERIAILADDSSYSRALAGGVRTWAGRFGLRVVHAGSFPRGTTEFGPIVAAARAAGPEALLIASYLGESTALAQAVFAAGWRPRALYSVVGPGTGLFRKRLGPAADGIFSTTQWEYLGKIGTPGCREFVERYTREYGEHPSYFAATAFAAGQLIEAAVRLAGGLERGAVRDALATMDAQSIIGRYGVDRTGLQIKGTALVVQLQQGALAVVWPLEAQTAPPVLP